MAPSSAARLWGGGSGIQFNLGWDPSSMAGVIQFNGLLHWRGSSRETPGLGVLRARSNDSSAERKSLPQSKCLDTLELGSPKIRHFSSNMPRRGRGVRFASKKFTSESPARGPIQGQEPTSCRHFFCAPCWREILAGSNSRRQCPMCRENCSTWLLSEFPDVLPRLRQVDRPLHVARSSRAPAWDLERYSYSPTLGHWIPYHPILDRRPS